uniref:Response regulator transcription factor n=1 Tax=Roseihalotalea indica TaxID=2867963 RepID=A0AA49GLR5_9BACT|nr:response regulator transcription factor [Tunicatimonas sp. TK19036]
MSTNNINVVLADDHQLFRDGMKAMLQASGFVTIVGEASHGAVLLTVLASQTPDILLLDIAMPQDSGIDLLPIIKKRFPTVKCIMLTMHDDVQYVMRSLRHGADGYLLKDADEQELKTAIQEVYEGKKYFKNKISDLIVSDLSGEKPKEVLLSEREIQIVRLVAEGRITKEIADRLFVSVRTIETHRSRIMKRLGVSNTAEMIRLAYEKKLI